MRILLAALLVALSALIGAPARAADMPDYPDIEIPEVDYGLSGSFYLRGSAAVNLLWAREHIDTLGCSCGPPDVAGYGYSIGAGFGYETGTGLRFDGTFDYLSNDGLSNGGETLHLRAGVALANAYYDFSLGGDSSAGGGWGVYVGGGLGGAKYTTHVTGGVPPDDGGGWTPVAAAMAGVQYDMGNIVADVGYRLLYMPQLSNNTPGVSSFYINDATVHEVRGTVRYRFQ
jgi:opacity protein-like surface antigen